MAKKGARKRITAKQKAARRKNMAIARAAKKKGSKGKSGKPVDMRSKLGRTLMKGFLRRTKGAYFPD
jgi:hypothetical protein